jgi:hypothetical protein
MRRPRPEKGCCTTGKKKDKYILLPNTIIKMYSLALGSKAYNFIQNMDNMQSNFYFYDYR